MAKGIPLMGRDPDGKAKMINVDENGNVKVQQSGTNVVKQEVVLQRGIYSESTGRKILNKPPEARGVHLYCAVPGRTGTFVSGQGLQLLCTFNRGASSGTTSYGFELKTERRSEVYLGHHLFIGPNFFGLGNAEGKNAIGVVCQMELTTSLNFTASITGTFEAGQGFDIEVVAVWVR